MLPLSPLAEKRLFQFVVLVTATVPIGAGATGVWLGPEMIRTGLPSHPDLDSHFRYLSGLLLGSGLAFLWAVARVERRAVTFRVLGFVVIVGGLARLSGVARQGLPGTAHSLALVMELVVVPVLLVWLGRIERSRADVESKSAQYE